MSLNQLYAGAGRLRSRGSIRAISREKLLGSIHAPLVTIIQKKGTQSPIEFIANNRDCCSFFLFILFLYLFYFHSNIRENTLCTYRYARIPCVRIDTRNLYLRNMTVRIDRSMGTVYPRFHLINCFYIVRFFFRLLQAIFWLLTFAIRTVK